MAAVATGGPPPLPPSLDFPRIKLLAVGDVGVGKSCLIKRFCEGRFVAKYIPTIGIDFGVKKVDVNKPAVMQQRQKNASSTSSSSSPATALPVAVWVNFWDGSGDDDYREIRNEFYDSAQGILLVYDVRSSQSFENLNLWWQELVAYCEGLEESAAAGSSSSNINNNSSSGGSAGASAANTASGGKRASLVASTVTRDTAAGKAVGHNGGKAPLLILCANKADDTAVAGGAGGRGGRVVTEEQGRAWAKQHGCAAYYETSASTEKNVKEAVEDLVTRVIAKFM